MVSLSGTNRHRYCNSLLPHLGSHTHAGNFGDEAMERFLSKYAYLVLICLTCLFAIRVTAQLVGSVFSNALIPDFDRWYSGAVDYQILLPIQLLILSAMIVVICVLPQLKLKQSSLITFKSFAFFYFAIMFVRLIIALAEVSSLSWFQLPLPAFFHLVLASYLICLNQFIGQNQSIKGESACTR